MPREVLLPVEPLLPYVRYVMVGGFDGDRVFLPACADVQLLVYLRGGAWLIDPSGAETALPPTFLAGAVMHPRLYRVDPDSSFVAVTFRPGGLVSCLGISAADLTSKIHQPLDDGDSILQELRAAATAIAPQLLQTMLASRVIANASLLPPFDAVTLNLPVRVIARRLGISVRQFERRCLTCLGMPLRDYRRLARYSSAMMALMMQGASPQSLVSLALEAGYVDQAHFTRDFSALVGQPPGRFIKRRDDAQYQIWQFTPHELESYLS